MRVLIVQPAPGVPPHRTPYRQEVAQLGAALLERGWPTALAVFRTYEEASLRPTIQQAAPDVICIHVEGLTADLGFRLAEGLRAEITAPLVLFGRHARLSPDEALSRPGVEAVSVGPADLCIPPYLEAPAADLQRLHSRGMWINCASGVMRNPPPPPPGPDDLADQPDPARDLYGLEPRLDAAGFAEVGVSRGGGRPSPTTASDRPAHPGQAAAWPVRHRPVEAVLGEMARLVRVHLDLVGFRLTNARWAASPSWLAEFLRRYPAELALPIRTTLDPGDVTTEAAAGLKQLGCEEARIVVGSGSALIRNDILQLGVSNMELEAAFANLAAAGVPTAARVEIGTPYETPLTLDETLALLRSLNPDRTEARLHYPEPGTASYEAAHENGLLVGNPAAEYLAGRPALRLPNLPQEELLTALEALPYAVHWPRTAGLIRLARRVRCGNGRTLHELVVQPFLGPPVRKRRRR